MNFPARKLRRQIRAQGDADPEGAGAVPDSDWQAQLISARAQRSKIIRQAKHK